MVADQDNSSFLANLTQDQITIIVVISLMLLLFFCNKLAYRHQNQVLAAKLPGANAQLLRGMISLEENHQNGNNSKNEGQGQEENGKQPENEDFDIEQFDQMIVEKNMEEQPISISNNLELDKYKNGP